MDRAARSRSRANYNFQMKSSSLYFLNDISSFNSTENLNTDVSNWRDSYTFNPIILGRGHFSKVYKAKCLKSGKYVAIKVIRRRRLGVDKIDDIMKEIEMMQQLNKSLNPGFIQLLKYHISNVEVAVLIEFASGGSIYNVIRDSESGLPEIYTRIILSKIILALGIMHGQNIVHLDIKADNVLLRHPYPSTDVALADFGLARKLSKSKVHKEMIGTPDYIAPEVSNYDNISTKSDMWSVGVLTYFFLTNISPFCADTKEETLNRVTKAQFEFRGSLEMDGHNLARDFIQNLLIKIPEKRFTAEQCLNHDFLSSVALVEYPPVVQITEKPIPHIMVIDPDSQPQIRDNTNYKVRALVASQYDIESSFDNEHLRDPRLNLLKHNSANCLSIVDRPNSCTSDIINEERDNSTPINAQSTEDIKYSSDPVSDINENYDEQIANVKEVFVDTEDDTLDINSNMINTDETNHGGNTSIETTEKSEIPVKYEDVPKQHSFYSSGNPNELSNTSLSEITSSWNDTTNNADVSSGSESVNQEFEQADPDRKLRCGNDKSKSNGQIYNIKSKKDVTSYTSEAFARTKIYDSRRHIKDFVETSQLKSNSFRYSRDNLVDICQSGEYLNEEFNLSYRDDRDDCRSTGYNTIPLRNSKFKVKRRPLTKSVKRDFDKPGDTLSRRSRIMSNSDFCDPSSDCRHDLSKSECTLPEMRVESSKNIKYASKFSSLIKSKKPKKSEKKSWHCLIS